MKKNIFILLAIALTSFTLTSCGDPEPTPTATLSVLNGFGDAVDLIVEVNGKTFETITSGTTKPIPVGANVSVKFIEREGSIVAIYDDIDLNEKTSSNEEKTNPYSFTMPDSGKQIIIGRSSI